MNRMLWIDTETTGFSAEKNDIVEIACLLENDRGEICSVFEEQMQPLSWENIHPKALECNGLSIADLQSFQPNGQAFQKFVKWLYDHKVGAEAFIIAGYNTPYDFKMLKGWFKKWDREDLIDIMFDYHLYDVFPIFKKYTKDNGIDVPNHKLVTAAEYFAIPHRAHTALGDINATREVDHRITLGPNYVVENPDPAEPICSVCLDDPCSCDKLDVVERGQG